MSNAKKVIIGLAYLLFLSCIFAYNLHIQDALLTREKIGLGSLTVMIGASGLTLIIPGLIIYYIFRKKAASFFIFVTLFAAVSFLGSPAVATWADKRPRAASDNTHTEEKSTALENQPTFRELPYSEKLEALGVTIDTMGIDAYMELVVEKMQSNLPMIVDPYSSLVAVSYLPSSNLQINQILITDDWERGITGTTKDEFWSKIVTGTVNSQCTHPAQLMLMKKGLRLNFNYRDSSGVNHLSIEVNEDRCKSATTYNSVDVDKPVSKQQL